MSLSRNAIGNLIARYRAVLKKCAVINVLAASLLLGGIHGVAAAAPEGYSPDKIDSEADLSYFLKEDTTNQSGTLSKSISDIKWGDGGKKIAETKALNFNGNALSGTKTGISVESGYTLTVSGGTMSGFWDDLYATGSSKLNVSDMIFCVEPSSSDKGSSAVRTDTATATVVGSSFYISSSGSGIRSYGVAATGESGTPTISNSSFDIDSSAGMSVGVNMITLSGSATATVNTSSYEREIPLFPLS